VTNKEGQKRRPSWLGNKYETRLPHLHGLEQYGVRLFGNDGDLVVLAWLWVLYLSGGEMFWAAKKGANIFPIPPEL